jgi:DNA helicase-2/ATP-dependent DNA helicase PcrA
MDPLLERLTPAQQQAVLHVDGPLLILAGPGSGKTRVVTHRIANLLRHGIRASSILALTFTNKAADEMARRVAQLAPGNRVWTSTFHRFCARRLREEASLVGLTENFTIYDTSDSQQALKRAMAQIDFDSTSYTPQRIAARISRAKNQLMLPEDYAGTDSSPLGGVVQRVYPVYQEMLRDSNAVDFDDLLLHMAVMLRDNPELRRAFDERYRYVLVDEYQDTNLAQYAIVRALSIDAPNLSVTGDPDQSIYGWRGANIANILHFEEDYPDVTVVRLECNYRSTKRILRVADELIQRNRHRKPKALYTENLEGEPVRMITYDSHRHESDGVAAFIAEEVKSGRRRPRDFAVLYRVNALSRSFESTFRERGIPYQIVNGQEFYQRREIKDVLAYLRLINNPRDNVAFLRVVNVPPRGIGAKTLERLNRHALQCRLSLYDAALEVGLIEDISKRAQRSLTEFMKMYGLLQPLAHRPVEEILGNVLDRSGYTFHLRQSDELEDQQRSENLEELLTAAREFDERNPEEGALERFLEETSLVNDTDAWEEETDRVTLMTLHASKGLEFPVVFLVAFEEGLIPHERSREDERQLEEERRLVFVGFTRAEEELLISRAVYRDYRGARRMTVASQFLMELPGDELHWEGESLFSASVGESAQADESAQWSPAADETEYAHEVPSDDASAWEPGTDESHGATTPGGSQLPSRGAAAQIFTAAQLQGTGQSRKESISPERFHQGIRVEHPEYGFGHVVALSGSAALRCATVQFDDQDQTQKFMLAHCPLRPVEV